MVVSAFGSVDKCLPVIAVAERTSRIGKKAAKDELRLNPSVPDALLPTVVEAAGIRVLDTPTVPVADIAG
jgi:hypothetical protein